MNRQESSRLRRRRQWLGWALGGLMAVASGSSSAIAESPAGWEPRETPVVRAYRRVSPSVVNIHGQKLVRGTAANMAGAVNETVRQVNGMGTGVIIDPRGYLLTNYHVVEEVTDIRVTMEDKRTAVAEVVATDARYDLAVLKINVEQSLTTVPLGTSDDLMVGERVIAIGNAFGYEDTVTEGIISQLHRNVPVNETQEYRDLIQTSAGINPGNSGGPLVNIHGEVIGINVAVRVGANSIAFAIPIDQAIDVAGRMIAEYNEGRVWLGVAAAAKEDAKQPGVVVTKVEDNSPALVGGLKPGDEIVRVGNRIVGGPLDFELALLELQPGQRVGFAVKRGGTETTVDVEAVEPATNDPRLVIQRIWNVIGIQVEPLSAASMRQLNSRMGGKPYNGGMKVIRVRAGSPAESYEIRPGDVLVGLHKYETTSLNDLDMILKSPDFKTTPQTNFYIVRRFQTLEGKIRIAQSTNRNTR